MPELPEVQTVVTTLRPRVVGCRLIKVRLARADIVTPTDADLPTLIAGRTVQAIDRRGKRIIFTLENGCRFYIHLGMTGRLTIEPARSAALPHTHLEIDLSQVTKPTATQTLRFRDPRRFGGVWWLGCDTPADAGMGPEPLTLRSPELARRLAGTARVIKSALLDQSLVAGLGNIYVDEALFGSGIHPLRRACDLTPGEVVKLNRAIKATLNNAIRHRGSTLRDYIDADGNAGRFQLLHRVYDRQGEPCLLCQTLISRIVIGGRSTHFCGRCQGAAEASG